MTPIQLTQCSWLHTDTCLLNTIQAWCLPRMVTYLSGFVHEEMVGHHGRHHWQHTVVKVRDLEAIGNSLQLPHLVSLTHLSTATQKPELYPCSLSLLPAECQTYLSDQGLLVFFSSLQDQRNVTKWAFTDCSFLPFCVTIRPCSKWANSFTIWFGRKKKQTRHQILASKQLGRHKIRVLFSPSNK